jgi:hypothetical protein
MGVDDGELPFRQAAEEIRRAGGLFVEEGTKDQIPKIRALVGIALDEVADSCYR